MNLLSITVAWAAVCSAAGGAAGGGQPVGRLELDRTMHEEATLTEITASRSTWRTRDGATLHVPTAQLVTWGRCPPWPVGPHVLLADGSVIAGVLEAFDGTTASVRSGALGRLSLPATSFVGYRRTAASQPAAAALEQGRAATTDPAARFFLLLRNDDRLAARAVTIRDSFAEIDWQGGHVAIPLDRIQSLTMEPVVEHAAPPAPTLRVALDDGSRFSLASLGPPAAALPCDPDLVVAVAADGAAATSLAALTPTACETLTAVGSPCPLTRGQTLGGDWPAARGLTGFTGIGIQAPARVRYRLDRSAQRFESTVAIDDSAGHGGSVVVRIVAYGGNDERREVFASPVLHGGDEPLVIRADVSGADLSGAREIELVVEPAGREESLDRTIWLDPRVIAIE
jgi:hypothetical protein